VAPARTERHADRVSEGVDPAQDAALSVKPVGYRANDQEVLVFSELR
jgi:hypothetical protein